VSTYYHRDHLSNRLSTNASGTVVAQSGHFPYGEQWYATGSSSKWIFTTYQRDFNSGNDYAMARYYLNRLGRFTSPDPMAGSAADPQSLNRYAYARSDSVNLTDPSGLNFGFLFGLCFPSAPGIICQVSIGTPPAAGGPDISILYGMTGPRRPTPLLPLGNLDPPGGAGTLTDLPITPREFHPLLTPPACAPAGQAPTPSQYAARGQAVQDLVNSALPYSDPENVAGTVAAVQNLVNLASFRRGGSLDAQRYGASPAYANYVFGVYMSAAGFSLPQTLGGANLYGAMFSHYNWGPNLQPDKNYPAIPASNVANITAGFNAQQNGTLCNPH
jgi:RHS repeat-associated protein